MLLAILHAIVWVIAIEQKEPRPYSGMCIRDAMLREPEFGGWSFAGEAIVARRTFHFHDKTLPVKLLLMTDMSAQFLFLPVFVPIALAIIAFGVTRETGSYIGAVLWIIAGLGNGGGWEPISIFDCRGGALKQTTHKLGVSTSSTS